MKYYFCSFMFDDVEENVKNSISPNSVSGHKFQSYMLQGLAENNCDISVINTPRIRRYPDYKKLLLRRTKFQNDVGVKDAISIGFINVLGLNYMSQIHNIFKELKKAIKKNQHEKIVLLVYNTYPAPTIAMRRIKKRFHNVILCNVIGDIYGKYGLKDDNSIHGKLIERVHNKMDKMASDCDAFALATESMADALMVSQKPHVVIEGMYDVKASSRLQKEDQKKTVFYAGALLNEYGITHMLRAFTLIEDPSFEFLIAGNGDAVEDVKRCAAKDERIKYLGFLTPQEVSHYQANATVLVNPRTSEHKYVKYSFASKNLEYLSSGVPYIAHDLPCNPPEYSRYIVYPDDETDEALARKIEEVCRLSSTERASIGKRNMEFILHNKNPKVQMGKLDSMLRRI